jgi:hypothetical protein
MTREDEPANRCLRSLIVVLAMAAPPTAAAEDAASIVVDRMRQSCPMAEPGEAGSVRNPPGELFADERLHALFSPALRWAAPPGKGPMSSTDGFDPRVFSGLYLPLFETTGRGQDRRSERTPRGGRLAGPLPQRPRP